MTSPQDVIGVDIAKDWIDIFTLSSGRARRIPSTRAALRLFAMQAPRDTRSCSRLQGDMSARLQSMPGIGPILAASLTARLPELGQLVRRTLYLAGFIASRYDPKLQAFRSRLEAKAKPPKLAIVATARMLLTILNAMTGDSVDDKTDVA